MINTLETKAQQLQKGFFSVGTGKETMLIMGSCRAVHYITYFRDWNNINGNRFTICFIDPFNWNWDMQENRTDYEAELIKQETNNSLLAMLSNCSIFIHEYYGNAQMFNCDKNATKNIYQFGLNPLIDITLPNFNDVFLLTKEIVQFNPEILKAAHQDYNVTGKLSKETIDSIEVIREKNLDKFYEICFKTDFPEFAEMFKNKYKEVRYFHTFNHVTKEFNHVLFYLMNNKFLHLDLAGFKLIESDLFANNYTHLCEYDPYTWPYEQVKTLREMI